MQRKAIYLSLRHWNMQSIEKWFWTASQNSFPNTKKSQKQNGQRQEKYKSSLSLRQWLKIIQNKVLKYNLGRIKFLLLLAKISFQQVYFDYYQNLTFNVVLFCDHREVAGKQRGNENSWRLRKKKIVFFFNWTFLIEIFLFSWNNSHFER